jgi:3-phosphoshikimate 1-carboxyvinyltransferase
MITSEKAKVLSGKVNLPGDKSISHRSIILGSLSVGRTLIEGLLESEDVYKTIDAMRQFGAKITRNGSNWEVDGFGVGGFSSPDGVIDCGNSGTTCRLIMGAIATTPITAVFTGDESLSKRPMDRIIEPLKKMGARFIARDDSFLPITIMGAEEPLPTNLRSKIDSAQIKSAILLAGLNCRGRTTYIENKLTRDHTEIMLNASGVKIESKHCSSGFYNKIEGCQELSCQNFFVPADPSSAAFFMAGTLLVKGSVLKLYNLCMNKTRNGFLETIKEMGADIDLYNERFLGGELIADMTIKHTKLRGIEVPLARVPSMIDEYPILSILASFAEGKTVMRGISELKVKESDRIIAMARGLQQCGVEVEYGDDFLVVSGCDKVKGGVSIDTFNDHRVAMSFLCLGQSSENPIKLSEYSSIKTSFPTFINEFRKVGADIRIYSD